MTPVSLCRRLALLLLAAAGPVCGVAAPAAPADARGWLERIQSAAAQRNYQGTMVVVSGGAVSSSRVAHYRVGQQAYERVDTLDGRMQRYYRHNDSVQTVWPQERMVVVEGRGPWAQARAQVGAAEPSALRQYDLRLEGRDRVAGRDAQVLLLRPRDDLRHAKRLWADASSGLLLRAEVVGPGRAVLESTAFSEVEIGVKPPPEGSLRPPRVSEGWRVSRPRQEDTRLDAEGWVLARAVPGFDLLGCVRRPAEPRAGADASDGAPDGGGAVVQAVYSDGVAHVSLFLEPYAAARHKSPLQGQLGATATLMQRRGEHWITAVGDVPMATLRLFVDALERRP